MRNKGMGIQKTGSKYLPFRKIAERWQLYILLLPALIFMVLFAYKPMYGVFIAFQRYSLRGGIWGSKWIGFENFIRLFNSYWFPIILKNTLSISALSIVIGFPFPIIVALLANEIRAPNIKRTFQTVSYAPHFISTVDMFGMIYLIRNQDNGIINRLIGIAGIDPVYFMQKPGLFKWVYVLSGIWQEAGWGAIIYIAALSGVDSSLIEAAGIDGATRLQKIVHINLPAIMPTIIILFILRCGSLLSVGYEKVYLLQNDAILSGSEVISTYVYKMGLERQDFGFSTATGLFNSLINAGILIIVNSISRKISETSLW
jgi:putative aldouronate transport system permease protein